MWTHIHTHTNASRKQFSEAHAAQCVPGITVCSFLVFTYHFLFGIICFQRTHTRHRCTKLYKAAKSIFIQMKIPGIIRLLEISSFGKCLPRAPSKHKKSKAVSSFLLLQGIKQKRDMRCSEDIGYFSGKWQKHERNSYASLSVSYQLPVLHILLLMAVADTFISSLCMWIGMKQRGGLRWDIIREGLTTVVKAGGLEKRVG